MTFKAVTRKAIIWELSMSNSDRDALVDWLRLALDAPSTAEDSEGEDIADLIEELGVPL